MNKPEVIILHHSGGIEGDPTFDTSQQSLQTIDDWHKQLGFPKSERGFYIGYHWVCEYNTGKIVQTRNEHEIGCHVLGMNDKSLGILIQGNFDRLPTLSHSKPSEAQEKVLKPLLKELTFKYNIPIKPHRFYNPSKTCFGRNLPDDYGEKLIADEKTSIVEKLQEKKRLNLMQQIIETLKLLIIRMQNRLGRQKYD